MAKSDDDMRAAAKHSIKKKRGAWQFLVTTIVVFAVMNLIWYFTSPGAYYWPIWVLIGMGVGVIMSFVNAYSRFGSNQISDAQIDAEIKKMNGK